MILKQKNIKRALLCVLLVAALTALAALTAYAAAGPYELKLDLDDHTASVAVSYLKNDGTPFSETYTEDFTVSDIPYDKDVTIRITPKDGYTLNELVPNVEFAESAPSETEKPYFEITIDGIQANYDWKVVCKPRTFTVQHKPSNHAPAGAISHDYAIGDYTKSIVYGSSETVLLPTPVKSGYEFQHWEVDGKKVLNNVLSYTHVDAEALRTGVISIYPIFEQNEFQVTRYDYVFKQDADKYQGDYLGKFEWTALKGTVINGLLVASSGEGTHYGYRICGETDTQIVDLIRDYVTKTVARPGLDVYGDEHKNEVYRYYLPIVYTLVYDFGGGNRVDGAQTHTYDQVTELPAPTRRGHTFQGWNVMIGDTVVTTAPVTSLDAKNPAYAQNNDVNTTIKLVAVWSPIPYDIEYTLDEGGVNGDGAPVKHVYGIDTELVAPTRPGYHFKGWHVNGSAQTYDKIPADTIGQGDGNVISVSAEWEAKEFDVLLDGNVGDTGDIVLYIDPMLGTRITFGNSCVGVITLIPERAGYTFKGFYTAKDGGECYIGANGRGLDVNWALDDADNDGYVTLYAQWEPNSYEISLDYDTAVIQSVTINGVIYNHGDKVTVRYRETVEVIVKAIDGYKVVTWNGADEAHANNFVKLYRHETVGDLFDIKIEALPAIAAQSAKVDLITEMLLSADGSALPAGGYALLIDGEFWCEVVVGADGTITVDGERVDAIRMIDACYGHELHVVTRGTRGVTADSDPFVIALPARPEAPVAPEYTVELKSDRIILTILSENAAQYQYSISKSSTVPGLIWQDGTVFENLEPGTTYYVYVRVRGTETVPASYPTMPPFAFRTEPVTDEVGLILPIICLGTTLLCQLVAIGLLLNRRRKAKKNETLNGFAPVFVLAVRFLPAEALPVVLALAALVIIAQIVLIYLLATSDLIRRPKREPLAGSEEEAEENGEEISEGDETAYTPVPAVSDEDAMRVFDEPAEGEEEPVLTTLTDADVVAPGVADDDYHLTYESAETEPFDEEKDELFAEFDEATEETEATEDEFAFGTDVDEDAAEQVSVEYDEEAIEADDAPEIDPEADIDDSVFELDDEDELPDINESEE